MTSTPFNVGLGDGSRVSSRVLRPPGGGHTDIFGGDPEPPRGRRLAPAAHFCTLGQEEGPVKPTNGTQAPEQNGQSTTKTPQQEVSQVFVALEPPQVPSTNSVANTVIPKSEPVKAEPTKIEPAKVEQVKVESAKAEPAKTEVPKRVRVPPGGFSSGLW